MMLNRLFRTLQCLFLSALLPSCLLAQAQPVARAAVPAKLSGLSISGPINMVVGDRASFSAIASFSDGMSRTVAAKWLVLGNGTIDAATGSLTAGPLSACIGRVLVAAVYASDGITKSAKTTSFVVPSGNSVCTMYPSIAGSVLLSGWNLLGHVALLPNARLDVTAVFGDAAKVESVWKWIPAKNNWAFYAPTLSDGGAAYAASRGYDVLTGIDAGEGFWVNAKADHVAAVGVDAVTPVLQRNALATGWNLIAIGTPKTPSQFNLGLSATPPAAGVVPVNFNTLWAWDAGQSNWYFYAPSLEAQGGTALADFIRGKSYLDFGSMALDPEKGFWVNMLPGSLAPVPAAQSSLSRNLVPTVTDADKTTLASDDTAFALKLYRELLKGPAQANGNRFFSPLSISVALAMSYAGAKGTTASEMAAALNFSLPQERLHPAYNWLGMELANRGQGALGKDGQPFRLRLSNSLWGDAQSAFEGAFLDTLALNYDAGMNLMDFRGAPEASRVRINNWVAQNTEQRIKDILPQDSIDPLTRLVLVNAVYFNAAWQNKFHVGATASSGFTRLDGSIVQVNMMNQTTYLPYAAGTDYQAVELPYDGGELGMLLILPAAGHFEQFEQALDAPTLGTLRASLASDYVSLGLPKFKIQGSFDLGAAMRALGMQAAFSTTAADFSGISAKELLYISGIFHKSFIDIDENGTEAAAATAVVAGATAAPLQPKIVKLDRPFLLAIVDKKTGAIVFWGRVVDPTG